MIFEQKPTVVIQFFMKCKLFATSMVTLGTLSDYQTPLFNEYILTEGGGGISELRGNK